MCDETSSENTVYSTVGFFGCQWFERIEIEIMRRASHTFLLPHTVLGLHEGGGLGLCMVPLSVSPAVIKRSVFDANGVWLRGHGSPGYAIPPPSTTGADPVT